jgi:hypothetical protein
MNDKNFNLIKVGKSIFSTSTDVFSCVLNTFVNQDRFFDNKSKNNLNSVISVFQENISKPTSKWLMEK